MSCIKVASSFAQNTDEPIKPRTLKELLELRRNITPILGELVPQPLFDEGYPVAESEMFAVDFVLAKDSSRVLLGIQQDILGTYGQVTTEKSSQQTFPVISLEEQEREEPTVSRDFTDVMVVSSGRHFKDLGETISVDVSKVSVTLTETETVFLLDLPSATAQRGSKEGDLVEHANERYHNIKAQNRMLINIDTQTPVTLKKTRSTITDTIVKKDAEQLATIWKIFDAFTADVTLVPMQKMLPAAHTSFLGSMEALPLVEKPSSLPEEQFLKIMKTEGFKTAAMRMEHVLASNLFRLQQAQFKSGHQREPSVIYNYKLQLLWTFLTGEQQGRAVTCMCWSPVNENLLAVGYGKFLYRQRITGMVCCWSIMNPVNPQRSYHFETPVTAVHFSKDHPNLLAVGLYNGSLVVLDVAVRVKTVLAHSTGETSSPNKPVWHVQWLEEENFTEPQVLTGCQDGRICQYVMAASLVRFDKMKVQRLEGEIKGIRYPRHCQPLDIPVFRHAAALVIARHPEDHIMYYVGTDEGSVYKCSLSNQHQHLGVFLAHVGPVYALQFCPFDSKLLLTCGADAQLRVWAKGVVEPVLQLSASSQPVLGAAWSPNHSTVLVTIDPSHIFLWDLQRRTSSPVSVETTPEDAINTVVVFSTSGLNLAVGDSRGSVRLYSLVDMPPPPFRQARTLRHALCKALSTNPYLLDKIKTLYTQQNSNDK